MFCRCFGFWASMTRECSAGMLSGMVRATFSWSWLTRPGDVLSTFWFLGGGSQGMLCRDAFGDGLGDFFLVLANQAGPYSFWAAVARECSAGMLLGMVCGTFARLQLTRGHVLSMFWLVVGGCDQVALQRHGFGDRLGTFLQVPADQAGPCSVHVLACWLL